MKETYINYLRTLEYSLNQQGINVSLDLSRHLGESVTELEQFLYYNRIMLATDSLYKLETILPFKQTSSPDVYLKSKFYEQYSSAWSNELNKLLEQPKNAGKIEFDTSIADSFLAFLNVKTNNEYAPSLQDCIDEAMYDDFEDAEDDEDDLPIYEEDVEDSENTEETLDFESEKVEEMLDLKAEDAESIDSELLESWDFEDPDKLETTDEEWGFEDLTAEENIDKGLVEEGYDDDIVIPKAGSVFSQKIISNLDNTDEWENDSEGQDAENQLKIAENTSKDDLYTEQDISLTSDNQMDYEGISWDIGDYWEGENDDNDDEPYDYDELEYDDNLIDESDYDEEYEDDSTDEALQHLFPTNNIVVQPVPNNPVVINRPASKLAINAGDSFVSLVNRWAAKLGI